MEKYILLKAASILSSKIQVKFEFIKLNRNCYPLYKIYKILGVSKSGYYYWNSKEPSKRALHNLSLLKQIKSIHDRTKKRYGSPKIARELKASGFHASEKLIRKLMKQTSLESVFKRKFKITTHFLYIYPTVENAFNMKFTLNKENEV